jgi:hypothetical protein
MTPPTPTGKSAWLPQWRWLANPWISVVGTFTGILGLAALVYSWIVASPPRDLLITSDPPVAIVRAGQASSVEILYHGEKITNDVYARQVYVWNAGSDSIRPENVLEPIRVMLPHATILETRVTKLRRPLTNITAKIDGADKVVLSWNILEHNDGAAIDVIYAAPAASKLQVVGTIEHQRELKVREYQAARDTAVQGWKLSAGYVLFGGMGVLFLILGLGLGASAVQSRLSRKLTASEIVSSFVLVTLFGGLGAIAVWMVVNSMRNDVMPPPGF